MSNPYPQAQALRLLSLPDTHGALLAEFDFYPTLDLLHIRWQGHLTADTVVLGATAMLHLFAGRPLPARLFSNHRAVTGEWNDALPWLQYEWLPAVRERGIYRVAHLLAHNTASQLINYHGGPEFIAAITHQVRAQSFRHETPAWQWLLHH
jgi:hypothetical protein